MLVYLAQKSGQERGVSVTDTSFRILSQGQEERWRGQRPFSCGHVGLDEQSPKVPEILMIPETLTQAEIGEYPPTAA